jgi:hypothetical protein
MSGSLGIRFANNASASPIKLVNIASSATPQHCVTSVFVADHLDCSGSNATILVDVCLVREYNAECELVGVGGHHD